MCCISEPKVRSIVGLRRTSRILAAGSKLVGWPQDGGVGNALNSTTRTSEVQFLWRWMAQVVQDRNWLSDADNLWAPGDTCCNCTRPADGLHETHGTSIASRIAVPRVKGCTISHRLAGINRMHWGIYPKNKALGIDLVVKRWASPQAPSYELVLCWRTKSRL